MTNAAFDRFLVELNQRSPKMDYRWTLEKEASCQWLLERIKPGEIGVDVGGTEWLCEKLSENGADITFYDLFSPKRFPKFVKDDMMNVMSHFNERSLDFIVTRHTLEHSICPLFQLWAYNQLLKDNGRLYVFVPAHVRDWIWFGTHNAPLPLENWVMLFHRAGYWIKTSDAGSWAPANWKFIEHRFELVPTSRQLRLEDGYPNI